MWMYQVKPEITQEQLLGEARQLPPSLAGFLRHPPRLAFTDIADTFLLLSSHCQSVSPIALLTPARSYPQVTQARGPD
jgi:hypothetical protein